MSLSYMTLNFYWMSIYFLYLISNVVYFSFHQYYEFGVLSKGLGFLCYWVHFALAVNHSGDRNDWQYRRNSFVSNLGNSGFFGRPYVSFHEQRTKALMISSTCSTKLPYISHHHLFRVVSTLFHFSYSLGRCVVIALG